MGLEVLFLFSDAARQVLVRHRRLGIHGLRQGGERILRPRRTPGIGEHMPGVTSAASPALRHDQLSRSGREAVKVHVELGLELRDIWLQFVGLLPNRVLFRDMAPAQLLNAAQEHPEPGVTCGQEAAESCTPIYLPVSSTCELENKLNTFTNGSWLYANSLYSDPTICGYYVGIANAGSAIK